MASGERRALAAAAVALGGLTSPAAAAVHYVVVPIIIPHAGPAGAFEPEATLMMPLELTDAPVQATQGVISPHDVIAQHQVRAADAVVLDAPVQGRRGLIPAGTVLPRVVQRDSKGQETVVWCDLRHISGGTVRYDCLADPQGAGRMTGLWSALTGDEFYGFGSDQELRYRSPVNPPATYHKARPGERPTGQVGYEWCGGDGITSPPRFEVNGRFSDGQWESPETHACPFGQWAEGDGRGVVKVDRVRLQVSPGPRPKTLSYKLLDRIPPERLAHLEPGGPIRPAAEAAKEASLSSAEVAEGALVPAAQTARVASGAVQKGDALFSIQVRHAFTGVLTNDIFVGHYDIIGQTAAPRVPRLKAGQVVYARKVRGAQTDQLVWCAPRKSDAGVWTDAVCLPFDGKGHVLVDAKPALLVGDVAVPRALPPYANPPAIERKPVDLPPMTLSYAFAGWSKGGARLEVQVDWGQGPEPVRSYTVPASRGGAAVVPVLGGELRVSPGATADAGIAEFARSPGS